VGKNSGSTVIEVVIDGRGYVSFSGVTATDV
jgi:hypothetical protein